MLPEQVKTNYKRKKLASDDTSIKDMIDNSVEFNDMPGDDNDLENQIEMEKPEEPSIQSKAETLVEFMKSVKEGILKCNGILFAYFFYRGDLVYISDFI